MNDSDAKVVFTLVILAAIGYLLGSIPFGMVLTRAAGLGDIRSIGSGNIGATNVLRTGRRDLAALTLLLDAGKAALAYFILTLIGPALMHDSSPEGAEAMGLIGGAAAFIGHCYPVWLKFKGGKGVATFLGLLFAALFPIGVIFALTWLVIAAVFRMSSLAALIAALMAPLVIVAKLPPVILYAHLLRSGGSEGQTIVTFILSFLVVIIFWKHRANIARILAGTEPKIGAKKPDAAASAPGHEPERAPERGETKMVEPISPNDYRPPGGSG